MSIATMWGKIAVAYKFVLVDFTYNMIPEIHVWKSK